MDYRYIVVEGPIGVGKTSLSNILAERLSGRRILEIVEENPFLSSFYTDRQKFAFQTQIFFLLSRFRQQQDLFGKSSPPHCYVLQSRRHDHLQLPRCVIGTRGI